MDEEQEEEGEEPTEKPQRVVCTALFAFNDHKIESYIHLS